MKNKYRYLGIIVTLVVVLLTILSLNSSSEKNRNIVRENPIELQEAESVKITKKHDEAPMKGSEIILSRDLANSKMNFRPFVISDRDNKFVENNVAQLADMLDVSSATERDYLKSIALRQMANAKKLSHDYSSLVNEASKLILLEEKKGTLSDEKQARLESIVVEAELLQLMEKIRESGVAFEDELSNLLSVSQQQTLMAYEKDKIVASRSYAISTILNSFLDPFKGELSSKQIKSINSIPMTVASRFAVEDYHFGFSLSMLSDSITTVNTGSKFPSTLMNEAFIELKSTLTAKQIIESNIDERLY